MPEIQAFRAVRYNLGHVGSLSDVVSPPYDVIGPELQERLYQMSPHNFVRIDFNKIQPGDDDATNNRYTRSAKLFKQWLADGVLFTEADPALYVYYQDFNVEGKDITRRGFLCRHRLSKFGEGQVFPHEETLPAAKVDRLMLMTVTKANFSPIFGLYPDPEKQAEKLLDAAVAGKTPLAAKDHLGVTHRLWPVTDVDQIAQLTALLGPKPVFIADGHHRYETSCKYRDEVYDSGFLTSQHPANYTLMMLVAMDDPGLVVMPTHRLFRGVPELTSKELQTKLGNNFTCRDAGQGPDRAAEIWEEIETLDQQGTMALYTHKDNRWLLITLTEAGVKRMAETAKDHNEEWRGLGVALLHRLVIEDLLGCKDLPKPRYVHLVQEVVDGLKSGEFPLAALVMSATVDHIRQISLRGERMPAKSTYFYPKLLSGLLVNPLE
ncbi:MAG: DUF1015 domain-containing protein [Pirellulales bacterium]|nr:DUF1015 domain-containing protein [Pirellulales bacterium]